MRANVAPASFLSEALGNRSIVGERMVRKLTEEPGQAGAVPDAVMVGLAVWRALSGCWVGHVRCRDEEIEIALSRSPFSSRSYQLRGALVFSLPVELA